MLNVVLVVLCLAGAITVAWVANRRARRQQPRGRSDPE